MTQPTCTLENMTPDWIRILDGKFREVSHRSQKRIHKEDEPISYESISKKCVLVNGENRKEFKSCTEASHWLGRGNNAVSTAMSRTGKIKSGIDGIEYKIVIESKHV